MSRLDIKKTIKLIIIPATLLILWAILTFTQILLSEESITLIRDRFSPKDLPQTSFKPLLKDTIQRFSIVATQDNLGVIKINFNSFDRVNDDHIMFRLKEKNAQTWYYQNSYDAKQFAGLPLYPFGFPLITDSKNKEYIIEIQSEKGTPYSAVAVAKVDPILVAGYQFDKNLILSNGHAFFEFFIIKTIHSLQNNYLLFTSSIYLFPFVTYVLWLYFERKFQIHIKLFPSKKTLILHQSPFEILLIIGILFDIFFVYSFFDQVFLVISILWLILLVKSRNNSLKTRTYFIILLLLAAMPIFQFLGHDIRVEKAATWAFLLLFTDILYELYQLYIAKGQNIKNV